MGIDLNIAPVFARLLACVAGIVFTGIAAGTPIHPSDVYVLDGDTVRIHNQKPSIRLVGFNAPETGARAKCDAERALGVKATARVRDLVRRGNLDFEFVACACKPGTEGTLSCNYGRRCGILKADGVEVGHTLIADGLAVPFKCRARSCPPTPKPWCSSKSRQAK
jgi:endonuclease YncB( thermonuclease family)